MEKLTDFGKSFRIIRIKRGESLTEAAKKLHVSPSLLSLVERGKRRLPASWKELIEKQYDLSPGEKKELEFAFDYELKKIIKISKGELERVLDNFYKNISKSLNLSEEEDKKCKEMIDKLINPKW